MCKAKKNTKMRLFSTTKAASEPIEKLQNTLFALSASFGSAPFVHAIRRTNVPAVGRKLKRLTIVYLAPSKRIGLV